MARAAIVVLNLGQSNAQGSGAPDPAHEVPVPFGVYEYKPTSDSFAPLRDPTGEGYAQAKARSMNPMLGKRLSGLTSHDVIILPAAKGNTGIAAWAKGGELYGNTLTWWNRLNAYCAVNDIVIAHRFIHWLQGENDAGQLDAEAYHAALKTLIENFMADFRSEKVFATRIGYDPDYTSAENSEKIMRAQTLLASENSDFVIASTSPASFTMENGKMQQDRVHYTLQGYNQLGEEVAMAIAAFLNTGK